jgi:hypothetical protein
MERVTTAGRVYGILQQANKNRGDRRAVVSGAGCFLTLLLCSLGPKSVQGSSNDEEGHGTSMEDWRLQYRPAINFALCLLVDEDSLLVCPLTRIRIDDFSLG